MPRRGSHDGAKESCHANLHENPRRERERVAVRAAAADLIVCTGTRCARGAGPCRASLAGSISRRGRSREAPRIRQADAAGFQPGAAVHLRRGRTRSAARSARGRAAVCAGREVAASVLCRLRSNHRRQSANFLLHLRNVRRHRPRRHAVRWNVGRGRERLRIRAGLDCCRQRFRAPRPVQNWRGHHGPQTREGDIQPFRAAPRLARLRPQETSRAVAGQHWSSLVYRLPRPRAALAVAA